MTTPAVMSAPTTALAQQLWLQPREESAWERFYLLEDQPHRQAMFQQFHLLRHFRTVTEIGAMAGANIRCLRKIFPWAEFTGIEINPQAVAFAQKKFERDPHVTFIQGSLTDPTPLPPSDVIFTCYALAYVSPVDIGAAIRRIAAAAKVGIILAEPCRPDYSEAVAGIAFPEWVHPIDALLSGSLGGRRGYAVNRQVDPPAERLNLIVTAVMV